MFFSQRNKVILLCELSRMTSLFPTFLAPITKLSLALKQRGWKGVLTQLYTIGDLKFGELKGVDRNGNKYYENLELPYGQHRWVEYANIHNPDCSQIPPEWHGWMHHTFDEPINNGGAMDGQYAHTSVAVNSIFNSHLGKFDNSEHVKFEQHNLSQYRQRGYKIGSLMTQADEPEPYYKQPGHPLSQKADEGGRFEKLKHTDEWSPDSDVPKRIRVDRR